MEEAINPGQNSLSTLRNHDENVFARCSMRDTNLNQTETIEYYKARLAIEIEDFNKRFQSKPNRTRD